MDVKKASTSTLSRQIMNYFIETVLFAVAHCVPDLFESSINQRS